MNSHLLGAIAAASLLCLPSCGRVDGSDQSQQTPYRGQEGDPCFGEASDCQSGHCKSMNTFGNPGNTGTTPEGMFMCYESDGLTCDSITGRCAPLVPSLDSPPPANVCDRYQPTYLDVGDAVPKIPVAPSSPRTKTVATGYAFSCAVLSDGTVKCWGDNSKGQLGLGVTYPATPLYIPPTVVPGLAEAVSISAYDNHACVVLADGHVACWGTWLGVHGTAATVALSPVMVSGLGNVVALDVNKDQACAVDSAGQVWCWGNLGYDGIENTESQQPMSGAPSLIPGISNAIAVSLSETGMSYTYQGMACALLSSGQVQCWGHGHLGQSGLSPNSTGIATSATPITVANLSDAVAVRGTCVLRSNGQVLCWGEIDQYDPSTGQGLTVEEPMEMVGLDGAVDLANSADRLCILKANGQARCQALVQYPVDGGLGDGLSYGSDKTPVDVCNVKSGVTIFGGWESSCALLADGRLVCWGDNDKGQLGHGGQRGFDQPVVVAGL
jgi:alpha-tubulin suppressor-like RCC1 family protein